MKEKFIENGIEYVRDGDYYTPNLTVPDDKVYNIGSMVGCTQYLLKKTDISYTQ